MSTSISRMTSTARLPTSPPSTSRWPSTQTGASTPGTDMLARIATARSPSAMTCISPVSISEAIARNGIGRSSKSSMCDTGSMRLRSIRSSFWPCTNPSGRVGRPRSSPMSRSIGKSRASCLRRKRRSSRSGSSDIASAQSMSATSCSRSATLMPDAYRPPTIAPMLVPAIASIGTRMRSSSRNTPMCAAPRAPPPPSTSPTRGRSDDVPSVARTLSSAVTAIEHDRAAHSIASRQCGIV